MNVAIIGGGASGLFAAAVISKYCNVVVFEKNEKVGKKIYITGKGRCNFTNNCSVDEFLENVIDGKKFLQSALRSFPPQKTLNFFEDNSMQYVVERGNRAFPRSMKASDVTKTLVKVISDNNGEIRCNCKVYDVTKSQRFCVSSCSGKEEFDFVIIATGGISYPSTGSTGDGYVFAKKFGHSIVSPVAALTSIELKDDVSSLQGLSLKNVKVSVSDGSKTWSCTGEMLFTTTGVSGPCILTLSSLINRIKGNIELNIDLKPALDRETLDRRILRDFEQNINKNFINSLDMLLPKSLIPFVVERSGIAPFKKVNLITKEQRGSLVSLIKNLKFAVKSVGSIDSAVVTAGGIELKEINPKTMESKFCEGLYIVGETLDVDALTGGFNLQIAWSTAFAAATAIANKSNNKAELD